MHAIQRFFKTLILLAAVGASLPSFATRYQDIWWNPNLSGQGFSIAQQGETVIATWYSYDVNGNSAWYLMSGNLVNNVLSGDLTEYTGPKLGSLFDPSKVAGTKVGTATLTFTGLSKGTFRWTLYGTSGDMNIERFTFSPLVYAGVYYTQVVGGSDCTDATRSYAVSTTSEVTYDGTTIRIADKMEGGALCTFTGGVTGEGSIMRAIGTYTCNTASESGTWASSIRFIPSGTQTVMSRTDNLTRTRNLCPAVQTVAGAVVLR
jgi:hypothetical protein